MTQKSETTPDLQNIVLRAVEIAAERGLPLPPQEMADIVVAQDAPAPPEAVLNGAGDLAHSAPWNQFPPDLVDKIRRVDIMASLHGIAPSMQAVEREIENLITSPVKLIADLTTHTLGAGGKRLRPALTILAAQLCSGTDEPPDNTVIVCSALVELTHTSSLLHDDVVDDADVRRGKPAANLIWGNETSVLVGDYLFAQVFVTASQKGFTDLMHPLAYATAQMCAGELLETQTRRNLTITEKQCREIIALKTASLTECACRLGGRAMKANDEQIERLARFGYGIGMAFQIVDDVFDIIATQGRVGKPVGNDIREGDITIPMLRAMQVCGDAEKEELRALVGKDPINDEEVGRGLAILRGCDAVPYSLGVAAEFVASAKAQLDIFPDGAALDMLHDIADYVLSRDK